MFPEDQLKMMIKETNIVLRKKNMENLELSELLKLLGIYILTTRFEFGQRSELWSTIAPRKYRTAPAFGKTGMSRVRFDTLFTSLRWSHQPPERPMHKTSEEYRWMLVDDFVESFN